MDEGCANCNAELGEATRMKEYRLQILMAVLLIFVIVMVAFFRPYAHIEGKPYHHLAQNHFRNPEDNDPGTPRLRHMLAFLMRLPLTWMQAPNVASQLRLSEAEAIIELNKVKDKDTITWLGHATFLIRIGNKTLLTDPFLTNRAGPGIFGPSRYVPPGISIKNLPRIDMVLLSHNHYDSLDLKTISQLKKKENIHVIVPLYNASYFEDAGYPCIYELDWFQSIQVDGLKITAIPAIHYSGRTLSDRNTRLWAGYIIQSRKHKILFMCDSAYGEMYRYIGKKYGPFDAVIIDIGAYMPQEIMKYSHTTPEESVKIAKDLRAKTVIAMHWGTLMLSEEPPLEPPVRFRAAGKAAGYSDEKIWVMKIGETRLIP